MIFTNIFLKKLFLFYCMAVSVSNEPGTAQAAFGAGSAHACNESNTELGVFSAEGPGAKILSNAGVTGVSDNDLAPCMRIART